MKIAAFDIDAQKVLRRFAPMNYRFRVEIKLCQNLILWQVLLLFELVVRTRIRKMLYG